MNPKRILDHLSRYRVEDVSVAGMNGMAVLDLGTTPHTVTTILFDAAGMPSGGRLVLKDWDGLDLVSALADGLPAMAKSMPVSAVLEYFGLRGGVSDFARRSSLAYRVAHNADQAELSAVEDAASALLRTRDVARFSPLVSSDALDALSCVTAFGRPAYAFYAEPGEKGDFRRQAAKECPLLAGEMSNKLLVKMAIDGRKSLPDVLSRAFGVNEFGAPRLSKALYRKLIGKQLSDRGVPVQTLINALSEIPVDWFPKDDAEWAAFTDIADSFFRRLGPEVGENAGALANGASGKWVDFAARLGKAYVSTLPPEDLTEEEKLAWSPEADLSREAMIGAAQNTNDVIHAFRNYVILPLAAHAGSGVPAFVGPEQLSMAADVAARILYGGKSLSKMLELQRHWHTQAHNIEAATDVEMPAGQVKEVAEDGWAPLCDIWEAPNGIQLIPLTDPRELKDEGAGGLGGPGPDSNGVMGLGHCVGGYSARCKAGSAHIISFRRVEEDGSFTRLSTVEFGKIDPDSSKLKLVQHHGVRNGEAPADSKAAFAWFVQSVEDGVIPLNHDGVMAYLAGRRRAAEEVQSYSGYDWRERDAVVAAIEPWKPYLPKHLRGSSLEELMEMPELRDLIHAVAPAYGVHIR